MTSDKKWETRVSIEYGCSRGYWIKCFETEDEAIEAISSPNQIMYHWVEKAALDEANAKIARLEKDHKRNVDNLILWRNKAKEIREEAESQKQIIEKLKQKIAEIENERS